ncbi:MAG: AAA family ATPase [Bacteroides sp.]
MYELRNLPVGRQSFQKIRERNYLYVDKTRSIEQLLKEWVIQRNQHH